MAAYGVSLSIFFKPRALEREDIDLEVERPALQRRWRSENENLG